MRRGSQTQLSANVEITRKRYRVRFRVIYSACDGSSGGGLHSWDVFARGRRCLSLLKQLQAFTPLVMLRQGQW